MFFIKRSWYYVTRKIGKIVTVGLILFVVATLVLTGLLIKSASLSAATVARNKLGASVIYVADLSSAIGQNQGERPSPGQGFSFSIPEGYTTITTKEIEYIFENSTYVKNYIISASLSGKAIDFVYYNPSGDENEEMNSNEFGRRGIRNSANINVVGLDTSKKNEVFDMSLITSGRYFTDDEIKDASNVIIIESTIANLNGIEVGNTITISKQDMRMMLPGVEESTDNNEITFEVVGIYKTDNPTNINTSGFINTSSLTENTMYSPYTTVLASNLVGLEDEDLKKALLEIEENGYEVNSVTFNLKDPNAIDGFIKEVNDMNEINMTYRSLTANDSAYEKMVGPIENVANTSTVLVVVVIVAGAFIVGLLSMLSIKDRKYELGVLLSLGESKYKIIAQLITEMLIVSIIAFSLATLVSNFTAQGTTNYLLNQEISVLETINNNQFDSGRFNREGFRGNGGFGRPQIDTLNQVDVETIDELTVEININDILKMFSIGIFIIIIGNVTQAMFVLKANPKEILLER